MRRSRRLASAVAVALVASALTTARASDQPAAAVETSFTFAAVGDHGSDVNARAVLRAVGAADPDLFLSVGDLSYDTITPAAWCQMVKDEVNAGAGRPAGDAYGETFPFELLEGNHELANMDQYLTPTCLPDRLGATVSPLSTYGRDYFLDYPSAAPLARIIAISPGMHRAYSAGSADYEWVSDAIDDARALGIRWVIIANHFNYISTGDKGNEMGTDMFHLLVEKRVDLILQGHDHAYQRSKQLALGPGCAAVPVGSVNPSCIADDGADGQYDKGDGPVLVINGTGGRPNYPINSADPEAGYFARTRGSEGPGGSIFGFGSFTVSETSLQMTQVSAAGATFTDTFSIGATPDPPAVLFAESWPGVDGSSWPSAWVSSSGAGGVAEVRSGGGRLAVDAAGSWVRSTAGGVAAVGDVDLVTSYQWNATTALAYFSVFVRGSGAWQNAYRPLNGYGLLLSPNTAAVYVQKNVNGALSTLATAANGSRVTTAKQWLRLRVQGQQLMFRTWLDGQPEPSVWAYSGTDGSVTAPGRIYVSLVRASGNTGAKSVTLDDLTLTNP